MSDAPVYSYKVEPADHFGWWVALSVVHPGAFAIGPPDRWRPTRAWAEQVGQRWVKRGEKKP